MSHITYLTFHLNNITFKGQSAWTKTPRNQICSPWTNLLKTNRLIHQNCEPRNLSFISFKWYYTKRKENMDEDNPESNSLSMDQSSNNKSRNTTKARSFGKKLRHLMKVVCSAFLNPSKFSNVKGAIILYIVSQYTSIGILPNTMRNTSKPGVTRNVVNSPTPNLVVLRSLWLSSTRKAELCCGIFQVCFRKKWRWGFFFSFFSILTDSGALAI